MIIFRPKAAEELQAEARWYLRRSQVAARRFGAAVEDALERIEEAPLSFPILRDPDIRSAKVLRFPYRVVYVMVDKDIVVLAVAHAKRRPGYWTTRSR